MDRYRQKNRQKFMNNITLAEMFVRRKKEMFSMADNEELKKSHINKIKCENAFHVLKLQMHLAWKMIMNVTKWLLTF